MADYILSSKVTDACISISDKNNLHIDQLEILDRIIKDTLVGASSTANFTARIQEEIEIPSVLAAQISKDVNEQIFKPVQESLRAMQEEAGKAHIEEKHLTREELLHQLENPTPIPMSGRREISNEPRFVVGKTGMVTDTESAEAEEEKEQPEEPAEEEGTLVPISTPSRPRTILERKLAEPTVVEKDTAPIDPYREATN